VYSHRERREGDDKLWWVPSHKEKFDVRFFYRVHAYNDHASFPWKSIWRTKIPLKVAFFTWSTIIGKILRKRHVIVVNRCCLCKKNRESVDHLLIHCKAACALCNAIFSRFGLSWVIYLRVVDLFACWWTGRRS
jgi:hypothetical protein